ncbi:MAG: hypothetical protein K9M03_04860 [Kiritimatiellales bacterium]|nr:hypothetical protein [Kiritimatiellales bacterium]
MLFEDSKTVMIHMDPTSVNLELVKDEDSTTMRDLENNRAVVEFDSEIVEKRIRGLSKHTLDALRTAVAERFDEHVHVSVSNYNEWGTELEVSAPREALDDWLEELNNGTSDIAVAQNGKRIWTVLEKESAAA